MRSTNRPIFSIALFFATFISLFSNVVPAGACTTGNQWRQLNGTFSDGSAECASAIGVAANNVPWILRCGAGGIYYLTSPCVGSPICVPTPRWVTNNGSANHIAQNVNGEPGITDGVGHLWIAAGNDNDQPAGTWISIGTTINGGDACIGSLALNNYVANPEPVAFDTPNTASGGTMAMVYGIGCSGNPDANIYSLNIDLLDDQQGGLQVLGSTAWQQVGASQGNVGSQIALFTDLNGTTINQNPWVIDSAGNVSVFNASFFMPLSSGVVAITDHYVVDGATGHAWYWTGTADGGGNGVFVDTVGPTPNAPISGIAWSQAVPGTVKGTIGPSALWAIDSSGNIYYMYFNECPQIRGGH
jgi:hypothetical protein